MQEKFAVQFVEKLQEFFLDMRDMCRDFIVVQQQRGGRGQKGQQKRTQEEITVVKTEQQEKKSATSNKLPQPTEREKEAFMRFFEDWQEKYCDEPQAQITDQVQKAYSQWSKMTTEQQDNYFKQVDQIKKEKRTFQDHKNSIKDLKDLEDYPESGQKQIKKN